MNTIMKVVTTIIPTKATNSFDTFDDEPELKGRGGEVDGTGVFVEEEFGGGLNPGQY
jgi:hypothetical protein